ncbi:hypothetical protein ASG84_23775 [Rhodococcus sp. Leaf278]|uniref:serine hydrolase domain-containing protein n=1 Tax=Rhodococcus sp. Leaf278 TaxID=1736319 RepID=UPI00070B5C8E|nr:serine hydrolase domain-containing protein [Rhodococcus sp. Leaf278]KQU54050.1 hypothetical protein ASG84_23775 [Rhodococcus sp. Leaf278]
MHAALDALGDAGSVAAVAQVRDGESSWSGAAGLVERGATEPASADDPVRIASVTKAMVAAVVLQLVDEGTMQLDQPVDELLPGLLTKPVTVRQLLDHTSGIPDYLVGFDSADQISSRATTAVTDDQLIAQALAMPWTSEPGQGFSYSNTNYVVLGKIVADLDGKSVGQSLQDRIFDPLDMTATTYPVLQPRRRPSGIAGLDHGRAESRHRPTRAAGHRGPDRRTRVDLPCVARGWSPNHALRRW